MGPEQKWCRVTVREGSMPRWFTNRGITRHGIVKGSLSLSLSLSLSSFRSSGESRARAGIRAARLESPATLRVDCIATLSSCRSASAVSQRLVRLLVFAFCA